MSCVLHSAGHENKIVVALLMAAALSAAGCSGGGGGGTAAYVPVTTQDPDVDSDGDGWTINQGDCSEGTVGSGSELVNPGAAEIIGNAIDDDCDVATLDDTAPAACSTAAKFTGLTGSDLANAMELCQTASLADPIETAKWGLISAALKRADGAPLAPADITPVTTQQSAVLENFGTSTGSLPTKGTTMAGMSTGWMRDENDPDYVSLALGKNFDRYGNGPPDYLAAHGGSYPVFPGCNSTDSAANDSVNLELQIRVPTNAVSFAYDWRFFSLDVPAFVCESFAEPHLALLTSSIPGLPTDKNIVMDVTGLPVTANSPSVITACTPFSHPTVGDYLCADGTAPLTGTGFVGKGGSIWQTTTVPVVPGEVITLRLMVFDVTDNIGDTTVLYDNFRWNFTP